MSEKQALVDLVTITSALPADCFSSGRERCSNQYHAAANTTNKATAKIGFRYRDSIIPRINSHSAPPPVHATVRLVSSTFTWTRKLPSLHPVICVFLGDIRIHRLGVGDVQIPFGYRPIALLGDAAPVKRGGQSRIDFQRGVEIRNRVLGHSALQVDKTAAV